MLINNMDNNKAKHLSQTTKPSTTKKVIWSSKHSETKKQK